jgi:hypothetical protein
MKETNTRDDLTPEALHRRAAALGHDWPVEELAALVPVLERMLPAIAALAGVAGADDEPANRFEVDP